MTDTIKLFIWNNNIISELPKLIRKHSPNKINLFCAEEHEVSPCWNNYEGYNTVEKFAAKKELNIVFGSFKNNHTLNRQDIPKNANIYFWDNFWASRTRWSLNNASSTLIENFKHTEYSIPFITLNNQPHLHRCKMIDELSQRDMISKGAVSWHYPNVNYKWKHWKPKRLILDEKYVEVVDSFVTFPPQMKTSFMSLIAEATTKVPFVTEKTWTAIFFKKPFLMINAPGAHSYLNTLGFVNYDEVFDYSFDNEPNEDLRINKVIDNVQSILTQDLAKLYNLLLPKIMHNYNRAIEISKNVNMMPPICKEHYNDLLLDLPNQHAYNWLEMFNE